MRYPHRPILIGAFVLSVTASSGCLSRTTMSREEARSAIRSVVSLTAESELFVEFVRGGHATRHYAEGHAGYLKEAVQKSIGNLAQSSLEPGTENAIHECTTELTLLWRELSGIRASLDNDTALAGISDRLKEIRKDLERAQSGL